MSGEKEYEWAKLNVSLWILHLCLAWAFPEQGVISVYSVTLNKCLIQAFILFPIEVVQEMLSTVCSDKWPLH